MKEETITLRFKNILVFLFFRKGVVESAGVVEHTDCTSAER